MTCGVGPFEHHDINLNTRGFCILEVCRSQDCKNDAANTASKMISVINEFGAADAVASMANTFENCRC